MNWSADTFSAAIKNPLPLGMGSVNHKQMLNASILSFEKGDNSEFEQIFSLAVSPYDKSMEQDYSKLGILTADDLTIDITSGYYYYEYQEHEKGKMYDNLYKAKIIKMDAEKIISDTRHSLSQNKQSIEKQTSEIKEKVKLSHNDYDTEKNLDHDKKKSFIQQEMLQDRVGMDLER